MRDFVLVKGIIVTPKAAISWHPPPPQTTLLPKLCPRVDYVTSDTSVLKFQCVHICPSPACSVFKALRPNKIVPAVCNHTVMVEPEDWILGPSQKEAWRQSLKARLLRKF